MRMPVRPARPFPMPRLLLLPALAVLVALGAGCGASTPTAPERTLRIYVGEPIHGGRGGEDTIHAVRIAVAQSEEAIKGARILVVGRDDATPSGRFDVRRVLANARAAAADPTSIAYIGDYDSGATQIAMPVLNRAGILQVSPGSTAVELTHPDPREARRLVPTGRRTFARVVPNDTVQAAALTEFMNQETVDRVYVVDDGGTYGSGLAHDFERAARAGEVTIAGTETLTARTDPAAVTARIRRSGADAVFLSASDLPPARAIVRAVHDEDVHLKIFGGDALTVPAFLRTLGDAGLDTYLTAPILPSGNYAHSAQRFLDAFTHDAGRLPNPMAIFGYEAGRAVVASIRVATGGRLGSQPIAVLRRATRKAFFAIRERASALGSYSIDRYGDTTLAYYGAYRVLHGHLALGRALGIPPSKLPGGE
jgi:branched-chain amino acid transport system substrate-binding protein